MRFTGCILSGFALSLVLVAASPAQATEKFRNDKLVANELTLPPGESDAFPGGQNSIAVYLTPGRVEEWTTRGPRQEDVQTGDVMVRAGDAGTVRNIGPAPLRLVHIVFLNANGSYRTWGMQGLPPSSRLIEEDHSARVYEIRLAAQASEPLHTHHDRLMICLSGAELEHTLPSGTIQTATLKTGDIVWRPEESHASRNIGHTDLWLIAIEPK